MFCYGFFARNPCIGRLRRIRREPRTGSAGPAIGDMYRITAVGPGVTPDVMWQGPALHAYDTHNPADVSLEEQMNTRARPDPRRLAQVRAH